MAKSTVVSTIYSNRLKLKERGSTLLKTYCLVCAAYQVGIFMNKDFHFSPLSIQLSTGCSPTAI